MSEIPPVVVVINLTSPSVVVDVDPDGESHVRFTVSFLSIYEENVAGGINILNLFVVNYNLLNPKQDILDRYFFSDQNFSLSYDQSIQNRNGTIYFATLPNKATVNISIAVFFENTNVIFANQTIQV